MAESKPLHLYEEILLLALSDRKGTFTTYVAEFAIAGAVLAELMLAGRIALADAKKQMIELREERPFGDPILDEALERIAAAKRRATLQVWITRVAGLKRLRRRAALQLVRRGVLRADEKTVLLVFKREVYPEIDPGPERRLVERLRAAIESESTTVDPRTVIVISVAKGLGLLDGVLGKGLVKRRKKRIERIVNGEATGKAARAVVEAAEAAVFVATMVPVIAASTSN